MLWGMHCIFLVLEALSLRLNIAHKPYIKWSLGPKTQKIHQPLEPSVHPLTQRPHILRLLGFKRLNNTSFCSIFGC